MPAGNRPASAAFLWSRDPYREWLASAGGAPAGQEGSPGSTTIPAAIDWAVSLGEATLADGSSPAAFPFDFFHASCSDWVVFGLNAAGQTGGQANLVAFTNLYVSGSRGNGQSGICEAPGTHTNPAVMFALNTSTIGGAIATWPVISLDGNKIAFVESGFHATVFHVLNIAGNGSGTPTQASAPVSGTLQSVMLSASAGDSFSHPYVNFSDDIAYVGTDDGVLHKITGVFLGTPVEVRTAPWPIRLSAKDRLTGPVVDFATGNIFLAASNGKLYSVACSPGPPESCTVAHSATHVGRNSIFDPPIVDSSDQRAYWFSRDDGAGVPVLVQTDTALLEQARAKLEVGTTTRHNENIVRSGAFDDAFFSVGSGNLWVCGFTANPAGLRPGLYPTLLRFAVSGGTLTTTPNASLLISTAKGDACSSVTEAFDGSTDRFFVGTGERGIRGDNICTHGCMQSFTASGNAIVRQAVAPEGGLSSGIIIDNEDTASAQSANIYFATRAREKAVKLTQAGLQ